MPKCNSSRAVQWGFILMPFFSRCFFNFSYSNTAYDDGGENPHFRKRKIQPLISLNSKLEQVHQFLGDKYKEIGKEQISIFHIHSAEKISEKKLKPLLQSIVIKEKIYSMSDRSEPIRQGVVAD